MGMWDARPENIAEDEKGIEEAENLEDDMG